VQGTLFFYAKLRHIHYGNLDQAHFGFAVYALGFYIDEEAAKKSLGAKFSNAESSSLAKNQSLCDGNLLRIAASCTSLGMLPPCVQACIFPVAFSLLHVDADGGSLCAEVVNSQDIEKTVRIVITSGMVDHNRFLGGLKESLVPACDKVATITSHLPSPSYHTPHCCRPQGSCRELQCPVALNRPWRTRQVELVTFSCCILVPLAV